MIFMELISDSNANNLTLHVTPALVTPQINNWDSSLPNMVGGEYLILRAAVLTRCYVRQDTLTSSSALYFLS